jgi:hypothetical protein
MRPGMYEEVRDSANGRWGTSEPIFRGPCGPLFNWIDYVIESLRHQTPIKAALILVGVLIVGALINSVVEDETVNVITAGGDHCAGGRDLYEKANHR